MKSWYPSPMHLRAIQISNIRSLKNLHWALPNKQDGAGWYVILVTMVQASHHSCKRLRWHWLVPMKPELPAKTLTNGVAGQ